MNQYVYFTLGIILGIACAIVFYENREEKIEKRIQFDKKMFSTEKLDNAMENAVKRISAQIQELRRALTEDEKNAIIAQCCKEKFNFE